METAFELFHIDEPKLDFRYGQKMESPRDGLYLFGPLDESHPGVLRAGVIGTFSGLKKYGQWVKAIQRFIPTVEGRELHTPFPGFEAAFRTKWNPDPFVKIQINGDALNEAIHASNRQEAVYRAVDIYYKAIEKHLLEEENRPDVWFVVIPDTIYQYGRPNSTVPKFKQTVSTVTISRGAAKRMRDTLSLFSEDEAQYESYLEINKYARNFRSQLKARLLSKGQVVQIVRESTIAPSEDRRVQDAATIAWNLSTTAFFKTNGKPWKIANVREGVCYIGLVFKKIHEDDTNKNACCAAQMFLNSGDGLVFKGALGPWYSPTDKSYHLSKEEAARLISTVLEAYAKTHDGEKPKELFIHGKTYFNQEEWDGFNSAVDAGTKIVGVRIDSTSGARIKLYTPHDYPVLRGTAIKMSDNFGYLWTTGFTPRIQTYEGPETPNPLEIYIQKGSADIKQVMQDVMALTKVNFNTCKLGDGEPVTLRFADTVGEILTAAPNEDTPPMPFKFYI